MSAPLSSGPLCDCSIAFAFVKQLQGSCRLMLTGACLGFCCWRLKSQVQVLLLPLWLPSLFLVSCETQEVVTPVDGVCAMVPACVNGACIGFSVCAILVWHLSLLLPAWVGKR